MNILLLGHGKTGSLVAEVARARGHGISVLTSGDNPSGRALTMERLHGLGIDVAIDFTTPEAVLDNIEGCARAGIHLVVGTTGWYQHIPRIRELVEKSGIGIVYASNFSVGVNLFFDIASLAATAARHGYTARIVERHHIHKKDAPSGTAVTIRNKLQDCHNQAAKAEGSAFRDIHIDSVREGEIVGEHTIILDSPADTITLQHSAKSRRGFAEGAVTAAEWIKNKKGFYEFHDILGRL